MTDKIIGGSQFITGERPGGFNAAIRFDGKRVIITTTLYAEKEGPPQHAHGGSLATLIDEAMGAAAWTLGHKVLAANLNINYHKPVPLNTSLIVHGWVESHEGRKVFTAGEIVLPDGSVSTSGTGLFIEAPDIFGGRDYSIPINKG